MSETKNWGKGIKSKCFPSKSRKKYIAALRQHKLNEIPNYIL